MNTIVKMKFGSHLYGTNTKDSDTDYKGVFMPTKEQILLGRIPKCYSENTKIGAGKNSSEDVDSEAYSLHYFLELACQGQTVAIDMLYAPDSMILETSDIWKEIVSKRQRFITKNMQAFLGYAMRQASKYGIKGSRLADAKRVLDFIAKKLDENSVFEYNRLSESWDKLPEGEHIRKIPATVSPVTTVEEMKKFQAIRIYEVCGKKLQETVTLGYMWAVIKRFYDSYGARARLAEKNEGIDWKAVSHAIRSALQLKELYTAGTIEFPLVHADWLKAIKRGNLDYKSVVAPSLEGLMTEVKELARTSDYPEKVDRKYWEKFTMQEVALSLEEKSWIII